MPNSLVLSQGQQNGQTILLANNRYALFEVIASTALATFYHATDTRTLEADQSASRVVVGIVNPILDQVNDFAAALPRVLSQFADPAVTPHVDDHGSENGQYWFTLANLKGTPLHSYINQTGRFGYPVSDTLDTIEHITKAVRQSPLKKDFGYLEPGAIYYEPESGRCTLLNSPIAITLNIVAQSNHNKELNRPTLHSGYLSPEVALGKPPTDNDDCFSIAVIAYQMLNGHLPFVNDHTVEAALKKSIPAAIAKLEPESSQVVLNALAFKREHRPASAEEFLHQIHNPPPLVKETANVPGWIKLPGFALVAIGVAYGALNYANHNGELLPFNSLTSKNFDDNTKQRKLTELQDKYEQEVKKLAELKKLQQEETQRLSQLKKQQAEESKLLVQLTQQTEQTSKQINSEKDEAKKIEALALQQKKEKEIEQRLQQQKEKEEKARQAIQKQQNELKEQLAELKKQREAEERRAAIAAAQKQREAEERRAAIAAAQKQREADERKAAIEAAQKQREANERRAAYAAAQKQREADERRAAWQKSQDDKRRAAAQKQREADERRAAYAAAQKQREADERRAAYAAAQKQREADERRAAYAAAQKQREADERRAAWQKSQDDKRRAAAQKKQTPTTYKTASVNRTITYPTPAPRLTRKVNPRFFNPQLFGRIPANEQTQADRACKSIGGIKALGFHPKTIGLDNSVFPSYFCAFNQAELRSQRLIAPVPAKNSPRLERKVTYVWSNQQSFGAMPSGMTQKGNSFCSKYGFKQAIKYHPGAIGTNGAPIKNGGYLCK